VNDLPDEAIRVTALCLTCRPNGGLAVTTDGTNRCPRCGTETPPESRGRRQIVNLALVSSSDGAAAQLRPVDRAPESKPASDPAPDPKDPVVLPASAAAWYGETAALYGQFEQQEAEALARFEQARQDVLAARRAKQAMGKILSAVTVEDEVPAMTIAEAPPAALPEPGAPKRQTRPVSPEVVPPPDGPRPGPLHPDFVAVEAGPDPAPPASGRGLASGQWSRRFDRCVLCGRTDSPHASRGRCRRCWDRERR
jgi:hypothetical protein